MQKHFETQATAKKINVSLVIDVLGVVSNKCKFYQVIRKNTYMLIVWLRIKSHFETYVFSMVKKTISIIERKDNFTFNRI